MGKNQSASGLTNIIQYDNRGNISFVSGSTTLMQVSSSGAITTTGVISGSSAQSASLAQNSNLLQGTGSVGFATTASFATASGSISTRVTQIEQVYATTGSNSFRATQSITGSLTVTGQIVAQTLNVQQVTSSIVFSSGSNTFGCDLNSRQTFTGSVIMTGSLIVNANNSCFSGIITGGSDIILCGTNGNVYGGTSAGSGTISNNNGSTYARFFGACHATAPNTTAFVNGNSTTLTLNANNTATFTNSVTATNYNACGNFYARYGTGDRMAFIFSEDYYFGMTNPSNDVRALKITAQAVDGISTIQFYTGNNAERMRITNTGVTCFACRVCAPNINLSNSISINACSTVTVADWYNTNTDDGNGLYIKAGGVNAGKYIMALENATGASRMIVLANGNVGIGCSAPLNRLTVNGNIGMPNTYNWGIVNDNDPNWGFKVCTSGANYSTFISYAGDQGSDRRGGIYNQNGHWVAYGNCVGHFVVQCNLCVGANLYAAGGITAGGAVIASSILSSTTQNLVNSTGNFAKMVHKIQGAAGAFSSLVICVNLIGAGGWGYIINSGGTGLGQFQSGGGYINGPGNFSHGVAVGSGFTVTCHTCAGTDNVVRFVSSGGVHPFVSIQMFGSLNQPFDDNNIFIAYS